MKSIIINFGIIFGSILLFLSIPNTYNDLKLFVVLLPLLIPLNWALKN